MFCLGKGEQTVAMLSFIPYIFSVISEGETTGLYVTGLYVLSCGDCLLIGGLEIKRRMAFIVNKSDTRYCQERAVFSLKRGNNFTKTYSTRCFPNAPPAFTEEPYLHTNDDAQQKAPL